MASEKNTIRKGARSIAEIPKNIHAELNKGELETANLVEWLAIDRKILLQNFLNSINKEKYLALTLSAIEELNNPTVNKINEAIGITLFHLSGHNHDKDFQTVLANHRSDTVRCWATYGIACNKALSLKEVVAAMKPFAADKHFGVREIAWLAIRPILALQIEKSITVLSSWTTESDENLRRFASEATRPRGVWCAHIDKLKQNPALGLPILEPLKSDTSKYVRDSVGNWLNDAAKSQPTWVKELCKSWKQHSNTIETNYITKKGLRSLEV